MKINLSARMACIASYIRPGAAVADVGTDHGYIPAWLVQNGIASRVIASDIKAGPLQTAVATAKSAGVYDKIDFRLCSGLDAYAPDEVDDIIMAGMGGETLISIMSEKPWTRQKRLVLQPQSKLPELRKWMYENGFTILDAQLVYDAGRIYLVWLATGCDETEGAFMPVIADDLLLQKRDPLLLPWLDEMIKRALKRQKGLQLAVSDVDAELSACREELAELQKLKQEVLSWQNSEK